MTDIPEFGFRPPDLAPLRDFEAVDLADLHRRVDDGRLQRMHRADFHTITLVTAGRSRHSVDFTTYSCEPGTLLWIRPGQVQSFGQPDEIEGIQLLFSPVFVPDTGGARLLLTDRLRPTCHRLGGEDHTALSDLIGRMGAEYRRTTASRDILRLLLAVVLLHVDRLPVPDGQDARRGGEVFARFHAELERSFAHTRRAEDYAYRLGYSVKTLTRACAVATGKPVKQVIDARVALEAQRLLAHADDPIGNIARRLGFSEQTNFAKFFARHTGSTPGEFRRSHRREGVLRG